MAVVINEVVTEVVLGPDPAMAAPSRVAAGGRSEEDLVELVVRRATERVLETLRREWEV
jgi:hypothetical protein